MRHEYDPVPAAPLSLEQLQIPDAYKIYSRNENEVENFLLADSGPSSQRYFLIFLKKYLIIRLKLCFKISLKHTYFRKKCKWPMDGRNERFLRGRYF